MVYTGSHEVDRNDTAHSVSRGRQLNASLVSVVRTREVHSHGVGTGILRHETETVTSLPWRGDENGKSGTASAAATGISTRGQKSRIHDKKRWTRHAGNPNGFNSRDTCI